MDLSKRSENVIALGKKIVEELSLEPGTDTLGRWMAHYIAELIDAAENESDPNLRNQARDKCCEAIIKLWDHRSSLPSGSRPLANLDGVLEAIKSIRAKKNSWSALSSHDVKRIGGNWMGFAKTIEDAGLRMCRIAILTAVAEASFGKEQRWLHEHKEMLSKEETKIIETLDRWLSLEKFWRDRENQVSIMDMEPDERNQRIEEEIKKLMEKINTSFSSIQTKNTK